MILVHAWRVSGFLTSPAVMATKYEQLHKKNFSQKLNIFVHAVIAINTSPVYVLRSVKYTSKGLRSSLAIKGELKAHIHVSLYESNTLQE